jgi:phosphoglycerate dehydrogenase-like enzyme
MIPNDDRAELPEVWVLDPIAPSVLDEIAKYANLVRPEEVRGRDWTASADGLIVRGTPVTAFQLERAERLRIVAKHGVGLDNIDVTAARSRGIIVENTPGANALSVAELAIGLALCLARRITQQDRALRVGERLPPAYAQGLELAGASVGIVGFGNTGSATARLFHFGFGSRVLVHDPYLAPEAFPDWVERVASLDNLLSRSRIVLLHVPLDGTTRGLIGARELRSIGRDGYVINLSRGGVVDEAALADALRDSVILGAASDVFIEEPPPASHPLLQNDNFIATPHIGGATAEALERVGYEVASKVLSVVLDEGFSRQPVSR